MMTDEADKGDVPHPGEELAAIYRERFSTEELAAKEVLWRVLCDSFFAQYVPPESTVLDLAAGSCEFINSIDAKRKIAVDLNPDVRTYARDAEVVIAPSTNMAAVATDSVDVV